MTERAYPQLAVLFDKLIGASVALEMVARYLSREILDNQDANEYAFRWRAQVGYCPPEPALAFPLRPEDRKDYEAAREILTAESRFTVERLDAFWRCWISFDKAVAEAKAALLDAVPEADEGIVNIFDRPTSQIERCLDEAFGTVNARISLGYNPNTYPRSMVKAAFRAAGRLNVWIEKLRPLRNRTRRVDPPYPIRVAVPKAVSSTPKQPRKKRRSVPLDDRPLTRTEVLTIAAVASTGENIAAAARILKKDPSTVQENYRRAMIKTKRAEGTRSRSVHAKSTLPSDARGQANVASRPREPRG